MTRWNVHFPGGDPHGPATRRPFLLQMVTHTHTYIYIYWLKWPLIKFDGDYTCFKILLGLQWFPTSNLLPEITYRFLLASYQLFLLYGPERAQYKQPRRSRIYITCECPSILRRHLWRLLLFTVSFFIFSRLASVPYNNSSLNLISVCYQLHLPLSQKCWGPNALCPFFSWLLLFYKLSVHTSMILSLLFVLSSPKTPFTCVYNNI